MTTLAQEPWNLVFLLVSLYQHPYYDMISK